jgi:hypothetical protein
MIIHQRIEDMIREAVYRERQRCADVAQFYPVETWADDMAEAIRVKFDISQAITKGLKPTEPLV